jgi:hypothetical protein
MNDILFYLKMWAIVLATTVVVMGYGLAARP